MNNVDIKEGENIARKIGNKTFMQGNHYDATGKLRGSYVILRLTETPSLQTRLSPNTFEDVTNICHHFRKMSMIDNNIHTSTIWISLEELGISENTPDEPLHDLEFFRRQVWKGLMVPSSLIGNDTECASYVSKRFNLDRFLNLAEEDEDINNYERAMKGI